MITSQKVHYASREVFTTKIFLTYGPLKKKQFPRFYEIVSSYLSIAFYDI